jgi:hypothetical protein
MREPLAVSCVVERESRALYLRDRRVRGLGDIVSALVVRQLGIYTRIDMLGLL